MENADLKSQLKERDARIAKLESVLEESRRAGKRQAAPFSKDKPKRDPKKPGRKPGSKYGRQAVRAIPVPDKTFEAPCPEQCPCGGKVGAEREHRSVPGRHSAHPTRDLEVRSGSWPLPGVWSACPWPASAADFEGVRGGHGAFRAQAARLRRVPEDDLRGVVRTRSAWDSSRCWVSPWRAPHCVVPCSVLPGVPSPPEMPWWRRCGPAPSSTPMRRAGSREVVGSGCGSSRTCARPSTRSFRAVVSSRPPRCWGKTTRAPSG